MKIEIKTGTETITVSNAEELIITPTCRQTIFGKGGRVYVVDEKVNYRE